jgi:FSR family fosmidomycin resistance protein-like MFS transporter
MRPLEKIAASLPAADRTDFRSIALLSAAHMSDDINQAVIPAMLPYFMVAHHLSYAAAGGLVLAQTLASSVAQPLFGMLADRRPSPWLIPLGLSLAGFGVAAAGLLPIYRLIFAAIAISGLGISAFHPEAARWTRYLGGSNQGTAMGVFTVGGNVGFAVGPLMITPIMILVGLRGAILLTIPVLVMSMILMRQMPRLWAARESRSQRPVGHVVIEAREQWGAFIGLTAVGMIRSVVFFGLNTFIPLYWIVVLHASRAGGGYALSILLSAAAVGTLTGGRLADRYGRRIVVICSLGGLTIFLLAFIHSGGVTVATMLLIPLGFAMAASSSVMVVMGQEYLPNRVGMSAGVTFGLSMTVGGLFAPVFGSIADHHGLHAAMSLLCVVPALGFAMSLMLREPSAGAYQ